MTINEYFRKNHGMKRPKVVCEDGFAMSVQASEFHYCTPRVTNARKYDEVEIACCSSKEEELEEYGDPDDVYGYVPVDIVDAIIAKHGGIANK